MSVRSDKIVNYCLSDDIQNYLNDNNSNYNNNDHVVFNSNIHNNGNGNNINTNIYITALKLHPTYMNKLFAGDNKGSLYLFDLKENIFQYKKYIANTFAITSLSFDTKCEYICIGFDTGMNVLCDLNNECEYISKINDHFLSPNEIDLRKSNHQVTSFSHFLPHTNTVNTINTSTFLFYLKTQSEIELCSISANAPQPHRTVRIEGTILDINVHTSNNYSIILTQRRLIVVHSLSNGEVTAVIDVSSQIHNVYNFALDSSGLYLALLCDVKGYKGACGKRSNVVFFEIGTGKVQCYIDGVFEMNEVMFDEYGKFVVVGVGGSKGGVSLWKLPNNMRDAIYNVKEQVKVDANFWEMYEIRYDDNDGDIDNYYNRNYKYNNSEWGSIASRSSVNVFAGNNKDIRSVRSKRSDRDCNRNVQVENVFENNLKNSVQKEDEEEQQRINTLRTGLMGDGDNSSVNKHIIYSLKTSRIGVANMKIHTEGGLLLRNSHKGYVYNKSSGNNNNSTQQHSKSTSHSKHKKAITRKINNKKMHKDSGNSSSNNTSKRNNNNNTSKSKTTKPQHVICTSNTNNGNNNHHHHHHQQQFITEHSFSFNNTNNNSISSIKSQLIKEGTYYSLESNRLSSYIKSYYTKHNAYPKTKLPFYKFGRLIGRGAFGKVNLGLHILSGRIVAIKSFNKSKLETPSKARDKIYHEVSLMRNLKHNLIIRIYETIETSQYILIIMEHINGGDLLSFVKKRTKLSEKTAKYIFRQLITALKHIHSHNIVHRDIKLDNILIDLNNNIKLCDFGVSKQIHKGMLLKDKCGTPAYIAPEILSSDNDNGYEGPPVDMWSSGVVLYAMLSGTVPFKPANLKELNKIMMKGEYSPIQDISKEATHLISGLLELDPKKRFTIDKVMNHPWLISDNGSKNEVMLFTKAEMVLLSKANVDYRYARKSEMMEHFTIKNLDTNNDKCNKNVSSKSFIFAPFNSTFTSVSDGDNEECGLEVEKEVIKFNNETQALNRIYELNYNGEIDHGVLIQHHSQDGNNNTQQQQQQQQQRCNAGVSLSINGNDKNNSLISGECYNDELESPLSHEYDCNNTQSNTQRNYVTSLTTTTITQHIDENTLNACERLGYSKPYMQYVLNENELNYATTTYYLLCNTTTTTTTTDTSI